VHAITDDRHVIRLRYAILVTAVLVLGARPAWSRSLGPRCTSIDIPVALAAGEPATERVYAELCLPNARHARTVQLLVPGSTYGHVYWDFPYHPDHYSYVRAVNAAGIATLNYDRVGSGRSSYPPSAKLTVESDTFVVHQLVTRLRAGSIGHPFPRVVIVGHSHGSILALRDAATYDDVDGLIVSGLTHNVNTTNLTAAQATVEPALLDSRFADRTLDPGYITYGPEMRERWIHNSDDSEAAVVAADEATKETQSEVDDQSANEFGKDILLDPLLGSSIDVPVLLADGEHDLFFCAQPHDDPASTTGLAGADCSSSNALVAAERPYFAPGAPVEGFVLSSAGHAINLERNASAWFAVAAQWTTSRIAR
jgi:alpha-beta hydrolase superfamily lysophospholipase